MRRTLLAIGLAVLASMLCAPHNEPWHLDIWIWSGWVHVLHYPFFSRADKVIWSTFWAQTAFVAVLAAVVVNLLPRRPRK